MEHIWAPWRMKYMQNGTPAADCIFCSAWQHNTDEKLVVFRSELAVVMLNRYPYANGHLLVAPKAHEPVMGALSPQAIQEIAHLLAHAEQVLGQVYNPEGFNVGANIGSAAGAGVADHVHFHIVPRWSGDTNFMTSVGDTRVLPETLEDTLKRIKAVW